MLSSAPWICSQCTRRITRTLQSSPRIRQNGLRSTQFRSHSTVVANDGLSPALLSRARAVAAEHATLAQQLAHDFDTKTAKRVGELSSTATAIDEYDKAQIALAELKQLLRSSDKELKELAEEDVPASHERISYAEKALKESLIPIHPFAHMPALIEIRPGAGGDEAALFAGDLLQMYTAFCAKHGLKTNYLKYETAVIGASSSSSSVHLQEAVLEVESPGAYGMLRCEAGVHRVQRVPATESKGRTHTSAASVMVLPSISDDSGEMGENSFNDPKSDYYVDPKDVRTDVMRASGAGGQHVNKTESAVRLTHEPSGTVVLIQETRSTLR